MVDCLMGMTYQVSTDANGDLNKLYYDVIPGERERLGLTELYEGNCLYPVYSEWRGVFYDTWTKAEYTQPIEMYLARKEAGLLPEILGEDIYNSLDQSKMY